jgi:hypothetical protein
VFSGHRIKGGSDNESDGIERNTKSDAAGKPGTDLTREESFEQKGDERGNMGETDLLAERHQRG